MLHSLKTLLGHALHANDGDIGHVRDFYVDDRRWVVRYVVAATGSWLCGRRVLLAPYAFGDLRDAAGLLQVDLSRKEIEDSPSIDTHKPVSRQYEEQYCQHYGWPYYWQGNGLWGMSGFPTMAVPPGLRATDLAVVPLPPLEPADAHLRSMHAVHGYRLQASDGTVGHVADFLMDAHSWEIRHLVIAVARPQAGRPTHISAAAVAKVSSEESTVFVDATVAEVERSSAELPAASAVLA